MPSWVGGASTYDGLVLSDLENVVVVTIRYRLASRDSSGKVLHSPPCLQSYVVFLLIQPKI